MTPLAWGRKVAPAFRDRVRAIASTTSAISTARSYGRPGLAKPTAGSCSARATFARSLICRTPALISTTMPTTRAAR